MFLAGSVHAQAKFTVEMSGKSAGTASLSQKLLPDGGKTVDLKMDLKVGSQTLSLRSQNTYDRTGTPVRKFLDANIPGGAQQRQIIATFDQQGANLVMIDGGKRSTRTIPLVATAPRSNVSEFWFLRDSPKSGESCKSYTFNMDARQWELQTVVYRGRKSIRIGGKTVSAHEIETIGDRPSKAFVDDSGLPYLIESGPTILRRV